MSQRREDLMNHTHVICLLSSLCILSACSASDAKPDEVPARLTTTPVAISKTPPPKKNEFSFTGKVVNPNNTPIAKGTKLAVLWAVNRDDGEYMYVLGGGVVEKETFTVTIPSLSVPDDALTVGFLGVAFVIALPPNALLPPAGKMTDRKKFRALLKLAIGYTNDHALIYIKSDPPEHLRKKLQNFWGTAFPQTTLQCGEGIRRKEGFDQFKPAPCKGVTLTIGDKFDWINWT